MHSLDVIMLRNAEAAGREAGHARPHEFVCILKAHEEEIAHIADPLVHDEVWDAFERGLRRGGEERGQ